MVQICNRKEVLHKQRSIGDFGKQEADKDKQINKKLS